MDFVSDSMTDGRVIRVLAVVDNFSKACPAMEVDLSISGSRVGRVLDRAIAEWGKPAVITVDNGPGFTSKAMDAWAYERGIQLNFVRPGNPVEKHVRRASTDGSEGNAPTSTASPASSASSPTTTS